MTWKCSFRNPPAVFQISVGGPYLNPPPCLDQDLGRPKDFSPDLINCEFKAKCDESSEHYLSRQKVLSTTQISLGKKNNEDHDRWFF